MHTPTVTVDSEPLNGCDIVLPFRVIHGRSSSNTQPDAPVCSFRWRGADPPFQQGQTLRYTLQLDSPGPALWDDPNVGYDSATYLYDGVTSVVVPRFTGLITKCTAIESAREVNLWQVECVGRQAWWGRDPYRASRPVETDIQRVTAIANQVGWDFRVVGSDAVTLAAKDVSGNALSVLWDVCRSTGGILWQDRGGVLCYGTSDHRSAAGEVISGCSLLTGLEWDSNVTDVVNRLTVEYGPADARQTLTYHDYESQEQWDEWPDEVSTDLAGVTDANALAATILLRRSRPWWDVPGVMFYSDLGSAADVRAINMVEVGDGVILPMPTTPGAIPSTPHVWSVEGWVETWTTRHRQEIQLAVSDRARWGAADLRTWGEVRDGGSWQHWLDNGTWLDQLTKVVTAA